MRNIITGPNASGKTVITRLIASVAYPDHVAELSHHRNVDIEVRWFDPYTHNVSTSGRSGSVSHVLDGRPVPYVARPYKTILLNDSGRSGYLDSVITLSQMFDLSASAMKATLKLLPETSSFVKAVDFLGARIDWVLDMHGRTERLTSGDGVGGGVQSLILLELAGVHARFHAHVEPTFLLLDGLLDLHHASAQIAALERLHKMVEHAQVAVITHSPQLVKEVSGQWTVTELEHCRPNDNPVRDRPIDFEIDTTASPPSASTDELNFS